MIAIDECPESTDTSTGMVTGMGTGTGTDNGTDNGSGSGTTQQQQQQKEHQQQERQEENNVTLRQSLPPSLLPQPPLPPSPPPSLPPQDYYEYEYAERAMNMTLFDPPRWGWTAVGGVADLLSPHERSRRHSTCVAYKKKAQRMRRNGTKSITLSLLATATGIETPGGIADSTRSTNLTPIPPPSDQQQQQQQQQNQLDPNTTTTTTITKTNTNTTITAQLKDPPAYSLESSTSSFSSPVPVARQSTLLENQSTSQSSPTPSSQSLSKDLQQPQNLTDTAETKTTMVAAPIATAAESTQTIDVVTKNNPSTPVQQQKEFDTSRNENNDGSCDQTQKIIVGLSTPGSSILVDSEGTGEKAVSCSPIPPTQPPAKLQPQQPAEIDIGVKVMGIPINILGMKIERTDKSSIQGSNNHDQRDGRSSNTKDLENNSSNRKHNKYNKNSKSFRRSGGVVNKYDCHVQCLGYDTNATATNAAAVIDSDILCGEVDGRSNEMILDMYTYHLGREGMEPRDAETGELLITQEVTDTNHDLDAPKLIVSIVIEFPLEENSEEAEDDDDDDDDNDENIDDDDNSHNNINSNDDVRNDQNNKAMYGEIGNSDEARKSTIRSSQKAIYREVITWDLSDKSTPTPLTFAASIGREYGLSFGQTMDLAASIDQQIETHVAAATQFREPITVENPQEQSEKPRHTGPTIQAYRYDEVIKTGQCGTFKLNKDRTATKSRFAATPGQTRNNGSLVSDPSGINPGNNGRRRDNNLEPTAVWTVDDIGKELTDEVKRRSREESVLDVSRNCKNGIRGVMEPIENGLCHICKKRHEFCYSFACSHKNHLYCQQHMDTRLGVTGESGIFAFQYCPICCLTCECARCQRKLKDVAKLFKAKSIQQEKELSEVYFPDILSPCTNNIIPTELNYAVDMIIKQKREEDIRRQSEEQQNQEDIFEEEDQKSPTYIKKTRTVQLAGQTMVPRPPLTDFAREVCSNGKELEAGTIKVYFTVFSAEGQKQVNDLPDAWLQDDKGVKSGSSLPATDDIELQEEEDGNVSHCHVCTTGGDLICCDFCPRSFHKECMENYNQSNQWDDQWVCYVCKKEEIDSGEYFMDGKESIDAISAAFLNLDITDGRSIKDLEVLSIIHRMLLNLMDYNEFGEIFSTPVDTSEFPGYKDIIKRPMDLGTISSRLINGDYTELLDGNFSMDDLMTTILNDIELIWRNCIKFNVIRSTVSRMAAVLRRRVAMIRRHCIDHKLSEKVKKGVYVYSQEFENAWGSRMNGTPSKESVYKSMRWKENAVKKKKPRSKSKITLKSTGSGKPIAILDTVSGRVVKTYSTVKSASHAAQILLKLGHRCEWNGGPSGLNLKLIAQKSASDPSSLLFGYRWLFLEDLSEGNVTFLKPVCDIIEMQHKQCTFVFRSIEEALSSSDLSKTVNIDELRNKLTDLPRNGDWNGIDGMKWRRPILPEKEEYLIKVETLSMKSQTAFDTDSETHSGVLPSWRNCTILKKDLVTDRNLVGFEDISFAHEDWIQTILCSPSFPESEARTLENFKKFYLDGDRNVDGIIWETVDCSNLLEEEKAKEATKIDNFTYATEIQDKATQNVNPKANEGNISARTEESRNVSSANESTIGMIDDQRITSKPTADLPVEESVSRKRKCLEDEEMADLQQTSKEARFSVVTV